MHSVNTLKACPVLILCLAATCSLQAQGVSDILKNFQEVSATVLATGQTQSATGPDADMAAAIDLLKAQIEQSMTAFTKSSMPDAEKLKLFDKSLANLDMLLDQTKEAGALDGLIQKSYAENKKKLDAIKQKANDTSIPAEMRAKYESRLPSFAKAIEATGEKRLVLIRTRNDLAKRRDLVVQNKQFYIDMMSFDDLEAANQTLDNVITSMNNLNDVIDNLGAALNPAGSGGPTVR